MKTIAKVYCPDFACNRHSRTRAHAESFGALCVGILSHFSKSPPLPFLMRLECHFLWMLRYSSSINVEALFTRTGKSSPPPLCRAPSMLAPQCRRKVQNSLPPGCFACCTCLAKVQLIRAARLHRRFNACMGCQVPRFHWTVQIAKQC